MKKLMLFILSVVMVFSLCACGGGDSNNSNDTSDVTDTETTSITLEEAEEIAKQEIVNECCERSYVSKISIDYGSFTHSSKGNGYEFNAQGTYLPKDDYGMYGDRQKFTIRLTVDENGNVTVNSKQISDAY